ncbi:hypothetical protein HanIR_Chr15g0769331 [Helianthus annuus]|nr:hypothetical protein HanIR_Chr15g0769331 [Helianthus annuus]
MGCDGDVAAKEDRRQRRPSETGALIYLFLSVVHPHVVPCASFVVYDFLVHPDLVPCAILHIIEGQNCNLSWIVGGLCHRLCVLR